MVIRTFLARTQETQGNVVEGQIVPPHKLIHKIIITSVSPITPNATSQSRDTQMSSRPGYNKGDTIDWAIAICYARRPQPHGRRPQHPCHRQRPLSPTIKGASLAS